MPQPSSLKPVDPNGWKVDPAPQPPQKPTVFLRHRQRSDGPGQHAGSQQGQPHHPPSQLSQVAPSPVLHASSESTESPPPLDLGHVPMVPDDLDPIVGHDLGVIQERGAVKQKAGAAAPAAESIGDADTSAPHRYSGREESIQMQSLSEFDSGTDDMERSPFPKHAPPPPTALPPEVWISSSSPPSSSFAHSATLSSLKSHATSVSERTSDLLDGSLRGYYPTPPRTRANSGTTLLAPGDGLSDAASVDMDPQGHGSFHTMDSGIGSLAQTPQPVHLSLNDTPIEIMEGTPITLSLLNLSTNYFLYANDEYVQLGKDGSPVKPLLASADMKLKTYAYPALFPLDIIYWVILRHAPSTKQVSDALQSPWGIVIYNCMMALVTALLARPLIKRAGSTTEVVVSVISGARILDTLLRDTVYKLLGQGHLKRRMVLICLITAQASAMITGSISLRCMSLLEFRAIPMLAAFLEVVWPLMHAGWILLGVLEKTGTVSAPTALLGGVVAPLLALGIGLGVDISRRVHMGWVDPFTCGE
ncbi:hypothetical protein HDU96_000376 [Phlyctochytrium bullatum]|nr:hypothetical protein HDU96_000376 [Phlyctochytrium bullatum]